MKRLTDSEKIARLEAVVSKQQAALAEHAHAFGQLAKAMNDLTGAVTRNERWLYASLSVLKPDLEAIRARIAETSTAGDIRVMLGELTAEQVQSEREAEAAEAALAKAAEP